MKVKWILRTKKDKKYIGYSDSIEKPETQEPKLLEWIEWNKEEPTES